MKNMKREDKRDAGMIIHLVVILLIIVWTTVLCSIVGEEYFNVHYNTPTGILFGIVCTTASLHGIYLLLTKK